VHFQLYPLNGGTNTCPLEHFTAAAAAAFQALWERPDVEQRSSSTALCSHE
jgi:hypothetical protein